MVSWPRAVRKLSPLFSTVVLGCWVDGEEWSVVPVERLVEKKGAIAMGLVLWRWSQNQKNTFSSLEIFFWLQAQQPQNYARYMVTCRCDKWLSGRVFKTPKWCWMEVLATNFILDGSVDSDEQISAYRWCCGLRMQVVLTHSWDNMPHNISGWVGCVEEV